MKMLKENPKVITVQIAIILLFVFIIIINMPQKPDQSISSESSKEEIKEQEKATEDLIVEKEVDGELIIDTEKRTVDEETKVEETLAVKEPLENADENEVPQDDSLYVIINGEKYPKSLKQIEHTWDPKKESYEEWGFRMSDGGREVKQDRSELLKIYSEEDLKRLESPRQWKPLPNVEGMTESDALKTMHKEGFTIRIAYEDGGKKEGTVIRQEIPGGRIFNTDASIQVYVQHAKQALVNKDSSPPPPVAVQPKPEKPVEKPVDKPADHPPVTQPPTEKPSETPEAEQKDTSVEPAETDTQNEAPTETTP